MIGGSVAAFRGAADWIERRALGRGKRPRHAEAEEPVQGSSVHGGNDPVGGALVPAVPDFLS